MLGMSEVGWTTESRNGSIHVRAQRDTIYGLQKLILGFIKPLGVYVHVVLECQGRDRELSSFPLVEETMNRESVRLDVSSRATRQVMNGFMNAIVPVSAEEARQLAGCQSAGHQIHFSSMVGLFIGIGEVPIDPDGRERLDTLLAMFS